MTAVPSEIRFCKDESSPLKALKMLSEASARAVANMKTEMPIPTDTNPPISRKVSKDSLSPFHGLILTERQKFLVFFKIYCKYIENTRVVSNRRRVKAILEECTSANREGHPDYTPLPQAIEKRLRQDLGEIHWARANQCFQFYCTKNGFRFET